MARQVHRLTDPNVANGRITNIPQTTVFTNNLLESIDGSIGTTHRPRTRRHRRRVWKTANGSPNVFINSTPVNRIGDRDTCGHPRAQGSPNVFVN